MKEYILQFDEGLYNEETGEVVFKPKVIDELIRCKDCKYNHNNPKLYWDNDVIELYPQCNYLDNDDFCSYGVRKE